MNKLYYINPAKINAKIAETVVSGYHIVVDNQTFEHVSKRPFGKTLKRSLVNEAKQERILIYG